MRNIDIAENFNGLGPHFDSMPTLDMQKIYNDTQDHGTPVLPGPLSNIRENQSPPGFAGAPGGNTLPAEIPFEFDPIAVENLRAALVAYDMMLLKNPSLRDRVQAFLAEHNQKPH